MLLDNLLNHLQELKAIHGGKIHIKLEFYNYELGYYEDQAISILKTDDQITIRNF
jgi:hypothetical protein